MNLESATLILRSINANENVGNFNNDMTWYNIDLKTLLGSMWGKYKRFKLILTAHGSAPQIGMTGQNGLVTINMEGLNWVTSSYDTSISANRSRAVVGTGFYSTAGSSINYITESGFIFDTQQTTANMRIYLNRVLDDTKQAIQYSPAVFCFSVYGLDD